MREGLLDQLAHLSDIATGDAERLRLSTSAREMILPGGMSSSFQVLWQKRIANLGVFLGILKTMKTEFEAGRRLSHHRGWNDHLQRSSSTRESPTSFPARIQRVTMLQVLNFTSARSRWSQIREPIWTVLFHRYPDGTDLSGLDLYSLANLESIVIRRINAAERGITEQALEDV